MEHALGEPCFDDTAGYVAGTGDCIVAVAPDTEAIEKSLHRLGRIWGVGDENHRAAPGAKPRERIDRICKGRNAVVHHAPDIAEQNVIVGCKRCKSFDEIQDLSSVGTMLKWPVRFPGVRAW